ncbi:hypothetical protein NQ314_015252 [Rhamnusium bicolor]|uniref:GCK domain-containing protein n=1 Tax=Rhamnusium bicolor TaxID=1586634 RepID=A0AAV8X1I9_9CUCU|nr:hypothetical protein NQ314_015252 [Rhamnusium bicolor]
MNSPSNDLVDEALEKKLKLDGIDLDNVKKQLEDSIPEITEFENFNKTNLPKVEDVENVLKEKCEKEWRSGCSGNDQQENVKVCIERYVNFTVVQEELEKAKETGSMDEVFGKYCKKWPSIYKCFDDVTSTARLCMDDNEEKAFNKSLVILNELQEFMCYKDGDRLAMFVAEGGVECVQERKQGVQDCLNATLGARLPESDNLSVATLPTNGTSSMQKRYQVDSTNYILRVHTPWGGGTPQEGYLEYTKGTVVLTDSTRCSECAKSSN